jgi:hypothetical protein
VGQVFEFEPTQTPDWQVSVLVQAFPSSHKFPVFATQAPVAAEQV